MSDSVPGIKGLQYYQLNGGDESRHACFSIDFRGKMFSFSLLRMMLAMSFFIDALYQVEDITPSLTSLLSIFIMKGCWILTAIFLALLR